MENLLKKLEKKVDKIDERLDNIDKHLAIYNAQLQYHIKRTDQNEDKIDHIEKHVIQVQGMTKGILKTVSFIAAFIGTVIGALKYIGVL